MSHENRTVNDEYYTPGYVFQALETTFDLDVSAAADRTYTCVPADTHFDILQDGLQTPWTGFVWMNPPYGNEKDKIEWLKKFIEHGNGIALMPDRTSATWWHLITRNSDAFLVLRKKVKFVNVNGQIAKHPSNGTHLFAIGAKGVRALRVARVNGLGLLCKQL